jgi:RNA polymerase sigma factor (TIGR02999 family)
MSSPSEITALLVDWGNGDKSALDRLIPLVERELHRLAHSYMRRERTGHTLETTGLINETYIRLIDQKKVHWQNRAHFFGIAAQIMRRILLNYARDKRRQKRGGQAMQVSLSEALIMSDEKLEEIIVLDEALDRLSLNDPRKGQVFMLRHFGGLTSEETAEVVGVSVPTVNRDWEMARTWLSLEVKKRGLG